MAQNIVFEDGQKEYIINGDESRVIYVSTSDFSILDRFREGEKKMKALAKHYEGVKVKADGSAADEAYVDLLEEYGQKTRELINEMFAAEVADTVFGKLSPLSTVKGIPLYERFINSVIPFIEKDLKAEDKAAKKRVEQFEKQAKRFSK